MLRPCPEQGGDSIQGEEEPGKVPLSPLALKLQETANALMGVTDNYEDMLSRLEI